jgi:homoserine O-acetyltransferase
MIDAFGAAFRAVPNAASERRRRPRSHSDWLPDTITQRPFRYAGWPRKGKCLTMLLKIAFSVVAVAALSIAQAVDAGAQAAQSYEDAPQQANATLANYRFRNGETLPELRLNYTTLGQPRRNSHGAIDNAILMLHWTYASGQALLTPEFRTALFAPGAPFDTTRYFVILPDALGHGRSSKPSDGLRAAFPRYGYGDMVDLQHRLVTEVLGITHLRAIVGISMGCMNAWQWAVAYPDAVDGIMPIACFPSPITGRNLLWRSMVVDAIKSDPAWAGGNYKRQPPSVTHGLAILRLMIDGVPHLQEAVAAPESADTFLRNVREQALAVDANDLIHALEASRDFDTKPGLKRVKAKVLAVNFADDEFYRDSLQTLQRDIHTIPGARFVVRGISDGSVGHLSMARPALWADQARDFVSWLAEKP